MRLRPWNFRRPAGFTLVETMVATAILGLIIGGFLASTATLQRAFRATQAYSTSRRDQMRLADYLALDLRRALTIQTVNSGNTLLSLTIPDYYAPDGQPRTPAIDGLIAVYGSPTSSTSVIYTKHKSSIYRQEAGKAATEVATDVEDFQITVEDLNQVVKTRISFLPKFQKTPGSDSRATTTLHNTTWLRNKRRS